ncbi:MAG TPA: acyltransferase family protein, partial [Bellilinea sp.]|nr:acyltransferase family protein [Bellilinea sp.]
MQTEVVQLRYDALTGIRFIAAFGVFVAHFGHFDFGAQGVSLFFVLSGFILTKVYTEKPWTPGQFYWARFARIYPAYFISLAFALPVYW